MNLLPAPVAINFRKTFIQILPLAFFVSIIGCGNNSNTADSESTEPNVVEITAVGLQFEAPESIPSGWNTFRLDNTSEMVHFGYLMRMPEGKGVTDHQEVLAPVFQNIMYDILGKEPIEPEAGFEPPEWFQNVVFLGGPGLVSAGRVAETTVHLEPGTYLLECYVKTNGIFHSYNPSPEVNGMVIELTVTEDSTAAQAPEPSLKLDISSGQGIRVEGEPTPGSHVVEVHFEDQNTYEHFAGHDVHLIRITDETNLENVASWMNWTSPDGLQTPAPAEFIGGVNDMSSGSVAYIHVDLEPGNYAWISEVPNPSEKGMLKTFTVSSE